MRKVGKIGKININSNRKLKKLFEEKNIVRCEVCGSTYMLSFAHRHKRVWYRSCPDLLSSFNQVLLLCIPCHEKIEYDTEATKELFLKKRGKEDVDK